MEALIKLLTENGIAIVCVAYLIYFQLTTMKDVLKTLVDMQKTQVEITSTISDIKDEISKLSKKSTKKEGK